MISWFPASCTCNDCQVYVSPGWISLWAPKSHIQLPASHLYIQISVWLDISDNISKTVSLIFPFIPPHPKIFHLNGYPHFSRYSVKMLGVILATSFCHPQHQICQVMNRYCSFCFLNISTTWPLLKTFTVATLIQDIISHLNYSSYYSPASASGFVPLSSVFNTWVVVIFKNITQVMSLLSKVSQWLLH